MRSIKLFALTAAALSISATAVLAHGTGASDAPYYVNVAAKDMYQRDKIVDLGLSIEAVRSDSVWGTASESVLARLKNSSGVTVLESFRLDSKMGGLDFPSEDSRFHNYTEMNQALDEIVAANSKIMRKFSIGKTLQGRDMWAVQINTSQKILRGPINSVSAKPGIVFMGNHHAREHVSAEMPLMLLEFLAKNYGVDQAITSLLDSRDVYIIPMVNADGAEFDISTGRYKSHRKNMRPNSSSRVGVDLNRNYGFQWGTGGSSKDPSSDVYMGPSPFSEPETQNIKAFVEAHPNLKVLLTYHTFSELILYPWGHKHDKISKKEDLETFEVMGRKMAEWNHYTPEASNELYIASGDTVDWAYGALGIFAFTFELSPRDMWEGGFYPGASILDKVFQDNLKPALYLISLADNPHRAKGLSAADLDWLK